MSLRTSPSLGEICATQRLKEFVNSLSDPFIGDLRRRECQDAFGHIRAIHAGRRSSSPPRLSFFKAELQSLIFHSSREYARWHLRHRSHVVSWLCTCCFLLVQITALLGQCRPDLDDGQTDEPLQLVVTVRTRAANQSLLGQTANCSPLPLIAASL